MLRSTVAGASSTSSLPMRALPLSSSANCSMIGASALQGPHQQLCCVNDSIMVPRRHWEQLLETGQARLLLDGVDVVADPELRNRLFDSLRDAVRHWPCPVIPL